MTLFFYSIVHIVSALEHPSSAVRRGVIARTITPARGPPAPFRTSGDTLSCAQSTLSWPSANVRTIFIFRSFYAFFQSKTLMYNNNCHTPDSCLKRALINTPPQKQFIPTHFHTLSLESSKETLKRFLFYKNAVKTAL